MNKEVKSYKDLSYWQLGMELTLEIYKLTDNFPKNELYGMTSQIRRCSYSIPTNIAEGYRRGTRKEYKLFLTYSFGSGAELETFLELSLKLNYISNKQYDEVNDKLSQIMKMLNCAIRKL